MSMSAEIICVGTELLLGQILNTNVQFLAQELAQLGIPHYYQTVVGDNSIRLKKAVAIACERSRILIFTGGLGPTPDDLTTETLADFFDVPLIEHPEVLADMTQKFAERGRVMTANNRKQALLPEGAEVLPNPVGSAPGMIWQPRTGLLILTFPGVPSEMRAMWQATAVPYLQQQGWGEDVIYSRTLKFWGIGESTLAEKVNPFFELNNPTVAPYASDGEVKLRISAHAGSEAEAKQLIEPVEQQLRKIAGQDYYGADNETLPFVVGQLLQQSGATVSVAESCTGGGLGQLFTDIPGSSQYFIGGITSYDDSVKEKILGVNSADLAEYGAVSDIVAHQMAVGVQRLLSTNWGISITGIAGPGGGTVTKPVGLVYIGLAGPDQTVETFKYQFGARRSRSWIRHVSAFTAIDLLRRQLISHSESISPRIYS